MKSMKIIPVMRKIHELVMMQAAAGVFYENKI